MPPSKSKARRTYCRGKVEKVSMADYIWKENGNHLSLRDELEIIDRKEHFRIRHLKDTVPCWADKYEDEYDFGTINQKSSIKKCNMS